jgi:hypothetical protein
MNHQETKSCSSPGSQRKNWVYITHASAWCLDGNPGRRPATRLKMKTHSMVIRLYPLVEIKNQNGTFRNEKAPGAKNGPLQINNFQKAKRNGRSVLQKIQHLLTPLFRDL